METITTIQLYVEDKNKDALIKKMLKINQENGAFHHFSAPIKEDGKWISWYYIDIKKHFLQKPRGNK